MFSSWTERQGEVGDLKSKSKEELREILIRQEKLLGNKTFIQSLPDKGQKVTDFLQTVKHALAHIEEEERKQVNLSAVRTEFPARHKQAPSQPQDGAHMDYSSSHATGLSGRDGGQVDGTAFENVVREKAPLTAALTAPSSSGGYGVDNQHESVAPQAQSTETMETAPGGDTAASGNTGRTKESDLVEALGRVSLTEQTTAGSKRAKDTLRNSVPNNAFFGKQSQKKPHYIEVLGNSQTSAITRRPKYKPNQLQPKPACPSPAQSPGSMTPLTAAARRQRDRKHLDDITAAKLPPLYHSPAQLLSLDESLLLLQEQTRKHQELQAKLAAQKLAEGLGIRMEQHHPDAGPLASYREVHDDGAELSSDED